MKPLVSQLKSNPGGIVTLEPMAYDSEELTEAEPSIGETRSCVIEAAINTMSLLKNLLLVIS